MTGGSAKRRPGDGAGNRVLSWGVWGCSSLIIALVLLVAVVAGIAYVELGEPDSAFPTLLAEAIRAAGDGGTVELSVYADHPWDRISLFPHGEITPAAVDQCIGFAWDNAALIAGHLAGGGSGGFVLTSDGVVVDYGWHLVNVQAMTFTEWPCALERERAVFAIRMDADVAHLTVAPSGVTPTHTDR